jgi:hypothetical protein
LLKLYKFILEYNLSTSLLKTTGIISESQRLVLHEIRLLGNDTVHEISSPKEILIKDGINTINSILYNVYGIEGFRHIAT